LELLEAIGTNESVQKRSRWSQRPNFDYLARR
jgi:hypothetical protein